MQVTPVSKIVGVQLNLDLRESLQLGSEIETVYRAMKEGGIDTRGLVILSAIHTGLYKPDLLEAYNKEMGENARTESGDATPIP